MLTIDIARGVALQGRVTHLHTLKGRTDSHPRVDTVSGECTWAVWRDVEPCNSLNSGDTEPQGMDMDIDPLLIL